MVVDACAWPSLLETVRTSCLLAISNVADVCRRPWKRPLFGIIRTPQANNIDVDSPLGIPIFTDAMQELRDLDIAYSRNSKEIKSNIEKLYEFIMDNGGQESFDRFIAFLQGAAAVGVNLKEAQEA